MQNYERKFGNEGYGTYGRGNFIKELPVPQRLTFGDFSGGLDMRDSREDTPANSSPNSLDVEVTMRDRLRPVPGTTTSEVLTRDAKQMMLQASLDYTSELVLFDAPFIGVKRGNATVWLDADLPVADRLFASVNFGGTLVFSNGHTGLFMRESGKDEVELIEHGPAAHTFASFAGRIFAGATLIGGNREPLGISWSGATSDPKEWDIFDKDGSQTGAGSELLIDDMIQGNYIVALRTMGLDFMAVFMRNSIWIGRRTSQLLRPADFQPRVTGVGAINEATCAVTRFGAVHLHDSGVYLFDGNNTTLISEQINNELLPLDRSQLNLYRAAYNPISKMYFLFTPSCTWVYDLERQRWHKRSLIARGASIFAPQLPAKTWAELLGTWADQAGTWEEYKAKELPGLEFLYLGGEGAEAALAREDSASRANFGVQMEPYWEFPLVHGPVLNQLISTKEVLIDYRGGGKLNLLMPDNDSEFVFRRQITLKPASAPRLHPTFCEFTGRGAGLRLVFQEGVVEILRVQMKFILRGPRIEQLPPPPPLPLAVLGDWIDSFGGPDLSDFWTFTEGGGLFSFEGGGILLSVNEDFSFARLRTPTTNAQGRNAIIETGDIVLIESSQFEFKIQVGAGATFAIRITGTVLTVRATWLSGTEPLERLNVLYSPAQHKWFRLEELDDVLTAYYSEDGLEWVVLATAPRIHPDIPASYFDLDGVAAEIQIRQADTGTSAHILSFNLEGT